MAKSKTKAAAHDQEVDQEVETEDAGHNMTLAEINAFLKAKEAAAAAQAEQPAD